MGRLGLHIKATEKARSNTARVGTTRSEQRAKTEVRLVESLADKRVVIPSLGRSEKAIYPLKAVSVGCSLK